MLKTACFLGGVACGFVMSSAMTDEQRRDLMRRARAVTGSSMVQRLGGSLHDAADAVVETAADKIDDVAGAITRSHDGDDTHDGATSTSRA